MQKVCFLLQAIEYFHHLQFAYFFQCIMIWYHSSNLEMEPPILGDSEFGIDDFYKSIIY